MKYWNKGITAHTSTLVCLGRWGRCDTALVPFILAGSTWVFTYNYSVSIDIGVTQLVKVQRRYESYERSTYNQLTSRKDSIAR